MNKRIYPIKTAYRQSGVAIITALLIVAIAVTVSIEISTRLQLDVRRTGNLIAHDQAALYIVAAEDWSRRILEEDRKNSAFDARSEDWAIRLPPLPVEGGSVQAQLTDLNACINLNALLDAKTGKVDSLVKARLDRLFQSAAIKNAPSSQALQDWLDADLETTTPDGAEDGYYLNLETPYRTANTALHSMTELQLIKSFEDRRTRDTLQAHVCVYPPESATNSININTASNEVLKSLSDKLTEQLAQDIIAYREETPFEDLDEFRKFKELGKLIENTDKLSVGSDVFLLRTQADIGQASLVVYSILLREPTGKTRIIARSQRTL